MDERRKMGVVVDAGHGGSDPGALGNGLKEKDLNLQAATYMYNRLQELGVPVAITRTTDEDLGRNERVNRILNAFGNSPEVIVISNHINAGGGEGAEAVYALRNDETLAKSILEEIGAKGQKVRKYYQRRLPENPSQDYYYIQRLTGRTEPILLEYGFIDNTKDANKLKNNLNDYVEGAVKAITEYAGYTYTPPKEDITSEEFYIVKRGDTLSKIATQYGLTVQELKELNNLTDDILQIGQELKVRKEPSEETTIYIVQKGDSLYSIASKFGITVPKLQELNNLTSNLLTIGQELIIKENAINNNNEQNPNLNTYTVQKGDSLSLIASKFNTTVEKLKELNNLTSNLIIIGEILKIPTNNNNEEEQNENNEIVTTTYIVKRGDSLYSVANLYNTTIEELIKLNNLTSNVLQIGQELIVPENTNTEIPDTSVILYTVQRGDNLYNIAREYNTTVNEIKNINGLISDVLQIGQVLQIPQSGMRNKKITYTVEHGDTIFSIAARNNLSVEELKKLNNIKANAVTIGQKLIIE